MNAPQPTPPKYSLQQLQDYIRLTNHFQDKVKEVKVTKEVIDWYKEQVKQVAKNLNIPVTEEIKEPQYSGVKLVAKIDVKK